MTGLANVAAGVMHEMAKNPELDAGLNMLINEILALFQAHAAKTATTVDDTIAKVAVAAAPFVIAKFIGVPNGANGNS